MGARCIKRLQIAAYTAANIAALKACAEIFKLRSFQQAYKRLKRNN
jgi:hypothetical protein